ncbi:MAG: sigma-70 family RNA polymerase sigma factor [Actinomycetota bacterium]|nr:sigma-70 family RNA polymerase sigma factor [Actinomycetota bacterium]MDA3000901.1 sigma-70 family RNA polymerase sigma factor [Actinomycetota bacterium]
MSAGDVSSVPPVRGLDPSDWRELILIGRQSGMLSAEEIVDVLHDVDLTAETIEAVRQAIENEGIGVDQSFELDDSGELRRPLLESQENSARTTRTNESRRVSMRPSASDGDSLRIYLHDISRIPLLDGEGERRLARAMQAGREAEERLERSGELTFAERRRLKRLIEAGERARHDLITANLRLVVSIAKRFTRPTMPLSDAIQSGNIGLMKAVERFDHTRGFKFSTYATWWIRQAISRAVADEGRNIRLPAHTIEHIGRIRRTERELQTELQHEPSIAEIAARLGEPAERIAELIHIARDTTSLDTPLRADSERTYADDLASENSDDPSDSLEREDLREAVRHAISDLPEREQAVMWMRFGLDGREGATLEEVGRHFGITRERVRQIEVKILSRLRHTSTARSLRDYADG